MKDGGGIENNRNVLRFLYHSFMKHIILIANRGPDNPCTHSDAKSGFWKKNDIEPETRMYIHDVAKHEMGATRADFHSFFSFLKIDTCISESN